MIIPKAKTLTAQQQREIDSIVEEFGCSTLEIVGVNRCVYAILGDETHKLMFNRILGLDYVARVDFIESTYKLVDLKSALAEHEVRVGETEVGGDEPFFIGGHCAVDLDNPEPLFGDGGGSQGGWSPCIEGRCVEATHQSLFLSRVLRGG